MFFQDEWHITPKLTLSPGVRYDRTFVPQPPVANPAFPESLPPDLFFRNPLLRRPTGQARMTSAIG